MHVFSRIKAFLFYSTLLLTYIIFVLSAHASLSSSDQSTLKKIDHYLYKNQFNDALKLKSTLRSKGAKVYTTWRYLTHKNSVPSYLELKTFIQNNPKMPSQYTLFDKFENTLSKVSLNRQKFFFSQYTPKTTQGKLAQVAYYTKQGRTQEAKKILKDLWRSVEFSHGLQKKIYKQYAHYLSRSDHSQRITLLLDAHHYTQAKALIEIAYSSDKTKYNIRYALQKCRKDALRQYRNAPSSIRSDGGVLRSLVHYYRKTSQEEKAIQVAERLTRKQSQNNAKAWFTSRNILSRVAFKKGLKKAAYHIIARHSLKAGGDYVTAEFYAGWLALRHFRQSKIALKHFQNGLSKSGMPISRSRFEYWIGRACQQLKDTPCAKIAFTNASKYFYTFYGQLAAHHLNQKSLSFPNYQSPNNSIKKAFFSDPIIQAAYAADAIGRQSDVRLLLTSFAKRKNQSSAMLPLLERITKEIGDLKTHVKVGKAATTQNNFLLNISYPTVSLKKIPQIPERALLYALTRQESEYDQYAKSHVGARGLMQIMPATAKQLARRLGKPYRLKNLTRSPQYNMTLGGFYLKDLVRKFDGSYIHALSGYNAGPSRIGQWNKSYGYFKNNLYQIIDRIETIPFSETRNYVQRILENTQIYRSKLRGRNKVLINGLITDLHRGL